jgi:uncharacterized protein YidB (DUF937 family)
MANRMPSLAALLGLVAVAGYQNRDRIGEFIRGVTNNPNAAGTFPGGPASPARPEQQTDMANSGYAGGSILGGLGELINHFKTAGMGQAADSWVARGPNQSLDERQMEQALGADMIDQLTRQTGLPRDELLRRLSSTLPDAIDNLTPDGQIPHQQV